MERVCMSRRTRDGERLAEPRRRWRDVSRSRRNGQPHDQHHTSTTVKIPPHGFEGDRDGKTRHETGQRGLEGLVETDVEHSSVQESVDEDPEPCRDEGPVGIRGCHRSGILAFVIPSVFERCRSCPLTGRGSDCFMPHPDEEMCCCVFPFSLVCLPSLCTFPHSS